MMNKVSAFHSLLAPPLNLVMKAGARAMAKKFEARDPFAAQRDILARLIAQGATTQFGIDHGLTRLAGLPFDKLYQRYRQRVPIRTYGDFWRDYFFPCLRERDGQNRLLLENVSWPGKIPFLCETSGTTAPTKYIPFSNEMFAENKRAALDLAACYLARNPQSRLFHGKLLYMAGNTRLNDMGNGVMSGDMSAITLRHRPLYLKPFVAPDPEVSALPWEEKLATLAHILLADKNIRGISGVPPWILLLLKRCVEISGKPLADTLPNLELIIHGGTSMKPYQQEYKELFGQSSPHFLELLPSSEAFMAFQLLGETQMRFAPYYGVFFEFVPFEELDERGVPSPDATAIPLQEVEVGKRYAVILTTCAGLWRYHIGDTIRFTSRSPLLIEFTGRDKFLDRFEEKVTQGEVEEAVARMNSLAGVEIREFMVGPEISTRRHLWVLATGSERPHDCRELANHLDQSLQTMNADYATFRSQGRIKEPLVTAVDADMIYRWSKEVRGKLGGQSKIPHIDPTVDGEMIRSLVQFASQQS